MATKKKKPAKGWDKNTAVARAIEAVGGPTKAGTLLGRSTQAIHKMRRRGYVEKASDLVLLARYSPIDLSIAELAGIQDERDAPVPKSNPVLPPHPKHRT